MKRKLRMRVWILICLIIISLSGFLFILYDENIDYQETNQNNEITNKTPINTKQDDWKLILVNQWNPIPDNYNVETVALSNGQSVDKRILNDLQAMMDDCRADGLSPLICSSYRTNEKQTSLYNKKVNQNLKEGYSQEKAKKEAATWVAIPGTSEHQVGLAVDIVAKSHQVLDKTQESTPEQKWLMENSYKYGFILRYPSDKKEITGISYEPWHYRYVGKEAASEITKRQITLEQYITELNQS